MEYERREEGEREHDAPNADQVHPKHVFCVTATAHDTRVGGHLVCRADSRDRKHDQKSVCQLLCLVADLVCRNDGRAEQKERDAREETNAEKDQLHGFGIFLRFVNASLTYRFADDHRGGTCTTDTGNLERLKERGGDRVGGDRRILHVTQDHGLKRGGNAEQSVTNHERQAGDQKRFEKRTLNPTKIAQAPFQLFVDHCHVNDHNRQLDHA